MKNYLKKYYYYQVNSESDLISELIDGVIAIFLFTKFGAVGFVTGFIILNITGFLLNMKNLDTINGNPLVSKSLDRYLNDKAEEWYKCQLIRY